MEGRPTGATKTSTDTVPLYRYAYNNGQNAAARCKILALSSGLWMAVGLPTCTGEVRSIWGRNWAALVFSSAVGRRTNGLAVLGMGLWMAQGGILIRGEGKEA